MKLSVGCSLTYQLLLPTPLLFNVQAMVGAGQSLGNEHLTITPSLPHDVWTDGSGNRFVRLIAPNGQLSVAYEADVETLVSRDRPEAVVEVPLGELPMESSLAWPRAGTANPISFSASPAPRSASGHLGINALRASAIGYATTSATSLAQPIR